MFAGCLANDWLASAFSALAEVPNHIQRLCAQQTLAADGRYDIKLFHPTETRWCTVTVDDRLPVTAADRLQCMQISAEGELW